MSKQPNKLFLILSNIFCVVFLFALITANFFFSFNLHTYSDLVYCPLQKTWVKQHIERPKFKQNPLEQICMNEAEKLELSKQILLKNAFAVDEKGVFETLRNGEKVLDNYRDFPQMPPQNLFTNKQSFSLLNNKNDFRTEVANITEVVSFQQFSRPPTIQHSAKFDFQISRTLSKTSRNINPRSPPFSS